MPMDVLVDTYGKSQHCFEPISTYIETDEETASVAQQLSLFGFGAYSGELVWTSGLERVLGW